MNEWILTYEVEIRNVHFHNFIKQFNVVSVHYLQWVSAFEDENHVYMVLEYCPNNDLRTYRYLKSKERLTEEEG